MGEARAVYRQLPGVTTGVTRETELSALTSIYELAIRKAEEKAGVRGAGENDPKEDLNGRANTIIPRAG